MLLAAVVVSRTVPGAAQSVTKLALDERSVTAEYASPLWTPDGNGIGYQVSRWLQADDEDEIRCPMKGVVYSLNIDDLPEGWQLYYESAYSDPTSLGNMRPKQGDCLLWGAGLGDPPTKLSIAAFGDRRKIENDAPLWNNAVYWYLHAGQSGGFSSTGGVIVSATDPGDTGLFDCVGRMSWLLNGEGGYRAGCTKDLGDNAIWKKMVFYGPAGVFCHASVCGVGQILKTEGLPNYCKGAVCESYECCMAARSCSADVCPLGFLLSLTPPKFCRMSLCVEDECCVAAPTCKSSDCGAGFHLKPKSFLPPKGQPRTGCRVHSCTQEECCDASPYCPEEVCPEGRTLTTIDPAPFCTSFDCTDVDCCSDAGVCDQPVCSELGFVLRNSTGYCDRPTCAQWECCDYLPPDVALSGVWFVDEDLREDKISGTVSWVLPVVDTIPNITHVRVYLGMDLDNMYLLAEVPATSLQAEVPLGTNWRQQLHLHTGNIGGFMSEPAVFDVIDTSLVPKSINFVDIDMDPGECGGTVKWSSKHSNDTSFLGGVCHKSASLMVMSGFGNITHGVGPSFFINGEEVLENLTVPFGSIVAVELDTDMNTVASTGVFRTGEIREEAKRLEDYLISNVSRGAPLLFATWGNIQRFMNVSKLAVFLEATELKWMNTMDSWAFIGAKRWPGAMIREQLVDRTHEAPAVVDVKCPATQLDVMITNGGEVFNLGPLPSGATSALLPMDTKVLDTAGIWVQLRLHTESGQIETSKWVLKDNVFQFFGVMFIEDDPTALQDLGGVVMWTPSGDTSEVDSYRIYTATDKDGTARRLVGEVTGEATTFIIPSGFPRANATFLLLYAVSDGMEQTSPHVEDLSDLGGQAAPVVVTTVVLTAMVLQFAKILEALERAAKAVDSKDITDVPMRGSFLDEKGNLIKISGPPPFGAIPWRGPMSQLLGPCGVSHHDKIVKMSFKTAEQRKRLPCLQRKRLVTNANMVQSCMNAWDNNELVVKKVSNESVTVFSKSGEVATYRRKTKLWYGFIQNSRMFSRKAIKMYAPMVALLGIAFLIAYSGEIVMAVVMLVVVAISAGVVFVASKLACTKDMVRMIETLPPKPIRKKVWKSCENLVGVLPVAPAFMAGTNIGYATGCICMTGSFLRSRKALALAVILEGFGGLAITLFIVYQKTAGSTAETADDVGKNTAVILGAVLTMTKAFDTKIENQERLHNPTELQVDELVQAAEKAHSMSGMGVWSAVALETFTRGVCEERNKQRLSTAMKLAASGAALRVKVTLSSYMQDIHHGSTRWPKSPNQLAYAVGRAIDAASKDLQLRELQMCRTNNHRQDIYTHLEGALEELEDSLRQLLNGPLASKPVSRYRAVMRELASSMSEATAELERIELAIGTSDVAGRRARALVLGHYASLLSTTATYVQDELSTGELSAVDLRLLFVKLDQMQKHATHAIRVVEGLPVDEEDVQEADAQVNRIMETVLEAVDLLRGVTHVPLPALDRRRLLEYSSRIIESAEDVARISEDRAQERVDYFSMEVTGAALSDLTERTITKDGTSVGQEFLEETSSALSIARVAVGLLHVASDEMKAATEKAEAVVNAMVQARRHGFKMLMSVSTAREYLQGLSVNQLQKLQKEAIEYTLDNPVQALVNLQEISVDSAKATHKGLLDEMQKVSMQLDTRLELSPPSSPKKKFFPRNFRFRRRKIAPADEDEDDDDDDDMLCPRLTKLDPLFELRETANGEDLSWPPTPSLPGATSDGGPAR